jgi:glycosyltransferase involved in cell wall biosynthesis
MFSGNHLFPVMPSARQEPSLNSPLKLLMICWTFPPDAQIGGLRVSRFCRYLPEFGIEPIVLTMEDRFRESVDNSLPAIPGLRIERTEVAATPVDWYRRSKAILGATSGNLDQKSMNASTSNDRKKFFRRQMAALLQLPGPDSGWYRPALHTARRLIREESIAAIFSSSPPTVSHRIALRLSEEWNLPWMADFRDPWSPSFRPDNEPMWWRYLNRSVESRCVRLADRVICNTEWLRKDFLMSHPQLPQQKFVTLTNGFDDPTLPSNKRSPTGSRRLFLHLGNIYGLRRIDTFCLAIENLVATQKIDPSTFQILFLGHVDPRLEASARESAPELFRFGCIEFTERVGREEAQQTLAEADKLLIFQGGHYLQVPAKFYDYLLTGRPILAVAQKGALTDLLEETGSGIWADPEKPKEIAANFLRLLALPGISSVEAQQRWYERFHYRPLTQRLAAYVHDLVTAGTPGAVTQRTVA